MHLNYNKNQLIYYYAELMQVSFTYTIFKNNIIFNLQKISGFVLAYFSYGSMLLIIIFLTGLLEFIQGYWYLGVITISISGE